MFRTHVWHNAPPRWSVDDEGLHFTTGTETDFWNNTHYGFVHANGHAFLEPASGDFSAEATFSARYGALYDQAGIMLRVNDANWIKTGIEFTDGVPHFSCVITRDDQSDWSVVPLPFEAMAAMQVRLTRHDTTLVVRYRWSEADWTLGRIGYLDMPETVAIGPTACSPVGKGLDVTFSRFVRGPAVSGDLHA